MAKITSSIPIKFNGIKIHNDLEGLNDGNYIHLTELEKEKFDSIEEGAQVNFTKTSELINNGEDNASRFIEEDELGETAFTNDYNDLDNLPVIPTPLTDHSELNLDDGTNPHGTTKADVGLGNVDNTSDDDKPISTATQTALNGKQNTLGFTPENVANKNNTVLNNSATEYPTSGLVLAELNKKQNNLWDSFIHDKLFLFDDYIATTSSTLTPMAPYVSINLNGGGSSVNQEFPNTYGVLNQAKSTNSNGGSLLYIGGNNNAIGFNPLNGDVRYQRRVSFQSLSTTSTSFVTMDGLGVGPSNSVTNVGRGAMFIYDAQGNLTALNGGVGSPNWLCVTFEGLNVSLTDTGVPVIGNRNNFNDIRIETANNGTIYNYFINNVLVATHNNPVTLPTTAMNVRHGIQGFTGSNNTHYYADYMAIEQILNLR